MITFLKCVMTLTSAIMCQLHTDADLVWLSYCIVVRYVIVSLCLVWFCGGRSLTQCFVVLQVYASMALRSAQWSLKMNRLLCV